MMKNSITDRIAQSIAVKQAMLADEKLLKSIETAVNELVTCYLHGNKTLFCGNGGSAADAQHLAAELSGKFFIDRAPIPAEACHGNTSFLTAYANDFDFDQAYARYIHSAGRPGDVLVAISTSGKSANIVQAAIAAREMKMKIVALTGAGGGDLAAKADLWIEVPSKITPRIQEAQILIGHIICELVEQKLFG